MIAIGRLYHIGYTHTPPYITELKSAYKMFVKAYFNKTYLRYIKTYPPLVVYGINPKYLKTPGGMKETYEGL